MVEDTLMEYRIVEGFKLTDLETKVMEHISNGWQPIGGVTIPWFQTMTRSSVARNEARLRESLNKQEDVRAAQRTVEVEREAKLAAASAPKKRIVKK